MKRILKMAFLILKTVSSSSCPKTVRPRMSIDPKVKLKHPQCSLLLPEINLFISHKLSKFLLNHKAKLLHLKITLLNLNLPQSCLFQLKSSPKCKTRTSPFSFLLFNKFRLLRELFRMMIRLTLLLSRQISIPLRTLVHLLF